MTGAQPLSRRWTIARRPVTGGGRGTGTAPDRRRHPAPCRRGDAAGIVWRPALFGGRGAGRAGREGVRRHVAGAGTPLTRAVRWRRGAGSSRQRARPAPARGGAGPPRVRTRPRRRRRRTAPRAAHSVARRCATLLGSGLQTSGDEISGGTPLEDPICCRPYSLGVVLFSSCWACLYYAQLICNKGLWREQVVVNSSIELSLRSASAKASWCWAALTRRQPCFIKCWLEFSSPCGEGKWHGVSC